MNANVFWATTPESDGCIVASLYLQTSGSPQGAVRGAATLRLRVDRSDATWGLWWRRREVAAGAGPIPSPQEALRMARAAYAALS